MYRLTILIQPVHPKGNQSWVFIGRTDVEAVTPILWPPDAKSWLNWKDPDAGKDWGQEEKKTTGHEMVGWHHRLDGRGFGWTPGVGDGWGGLACCDSWGRKESDMTEQLNWTLLLLWNVQFYCCNTLSWNLFYPAFYCLLFIWHNYLYSFTFTYFCLSIYIMLVFISFFTLFKKLKYSWYTILNKLQVYNIVIHSFYSLYYIYSYCKIFAVFPMYTISI